MGVLFWCIAQMAVAQSPDIPLSPKDVETLLRGGVTPTRVSTLVTKRGVSFVLTSELRERLQEAGASAELLATIEGARAAMATSTPEAIDPTRPVVVMRTSLGDVTIELDRARAPATVDNFLQYVSESFYDGTIFHRVIQGFMIQGGGFDKRLQQKATRAPIRCEAGNGLKNETGTIAMGRTSIVDSATAQFFINVSDNMQLNHRDTSPAGFGYAVFGRVVLGMDVVRAIEQVKTTARPPHQNVPVTPVEILSIRLVS